MLLSCLLGHPLAPCLSSAPDVHLLPACCPLPWKFRYMVDTGAANERVPLNEAGFYAPLYQVRCIAAAFP